ncbi:NAD(P)-binding domain-containing protein, partial [Escherichia coli]|uniref:NAD(P)-binding domain-containing protein n=1 Tax=Escherichia coli TaxID=562 RepID=UPI0027399E63
MSKQQIGVVGMAVMGRNLALNIESRGYTVSVFNRSRKNPATAFAAPVSLPPPPAPFPYEA